MSGAKIVTLVIGIPVGLLILAWIFTWLAWVWWTIGIIIALVFIAIIVNSIIENNRNKPKRLE